MKRKNFIICCIMSILLISCGTSPEDVIEKYREAKGCAELEKANTFIAVEKIKFGNNDSVFAYSRIMKKRPLKSRLEFYAGMYLVEVFNGTDGWYLDEFSGMKAPEKMSKERIADVIQKAYIDDPLGSYEELGYKVDLLDDEKVNNRDAYVIRLYSESGEAFYYVDKGNYMLLKHKFKGTGEFANSTFEKYFSNYKQIKGVFFPLTTEMYLDGKLQNRSEALDLRLNEDIPDSLFEKI